jgi:hypothetical protein
MQQVLLACRWRNLCGPYWRGRSSCRPVQPVLVVPRIDFAVAGVREHPRVQEAVWGHGRGWQALVAPLPQPE